MKRIFYRNQIYFSFLVLPFLAGCAGHQDDNTVALDDGSYLGYEELKQSLSQFQTVHYFKTNSYELSDPSKKELKKIAALIKRYYAGGGTTKLSVYGSTDYRGSNSYNEKLGFKRAQAVVNFFVESCGLGGSVFEVKSNGERFVSQKTTTDLWKDRNARIALNPISSK